MRGSRPAAPFSLHPEPHIHFFKGAEEAHKRTPQVRRRTPRAAEIPMPELVRRGDHGGAHRTVFMGPLGPRQTALAIDPQRESHVILWAAQTTMNTPIRLAIVAAIAASFTYVAAQSLDFETYRSKVEPIFLKKREGHARCVVCHAGNGGNAFLQPLDKGAATWTEEQSRQNFARVSKLVNPSNLLQSPLLKHPLAGVSGGDDFHSGGRQFASRDDPDWKTLAAWARGAK